jgi:hypothetical protein
MHYPFDLAMLLPLPFRRGEGRGGGPSVWSILWSAT